MFPQLPEWFIKLLFGMAALGVLVTVLSILGCFIWVISKLTWNH